MQKVEGSSPFSRFSCPSELLGAILGVVDYSSSKDAIQRGRSWPLKRSLLDAELERWRIADVVRSVAYMDGQRRRLPDGIAITVDYIGERIKTWQGAPGSVRIGIYAVPSTDRRAAQTELVEVGLPAACEWIAGICGRPETWRWESHAWSYRLSPTEAATPTPAQDV